MSLTNRPPQSKVTGHVHNVKECALDKDLTKLSKRELLDLIARQEALLKNNVRLQKLPDQGQKIQELYDRAVKALKLKSEIDDASKLLKELNLEAQNVSNLEWEGKLKGNVQEDMLDSDDDENPLEILTSSNTVNQNRVIVKTSPDGRKSSLVTEDDIIEAQEIVNSTLHFDPVLETVIQNENMEPSCRFLPHRLSFDNTPLSASSDENKKVRDNSAATPPVHMTGAKLLSLRESMETEFIQQQKLKEIQEKQAADRLALKAKEMIIANRQQGTMGRYRLRSSFSEHSDDEIKEESSSDEAIYE